MTANDKWLAQLRDLQRQLQKLIRDTLEGNVSLKESRAKTREVNRQIKDLEKKLKG